MFCVVRCVGFTVSSTERPISEKMELRQVHYIGKINKSKKDKIIGG